MPKDRLKSPCAGYARDAGMLVYKFTSPNKAAVPTGCSSHLGEPRGSSKFKRAGQKAHAPKQQRGTSVSGAQRSWCSWWTRRPWVGRAWMR